MVGYGSVIGIVETLGALSAAGKKKNTLALSKAERTRRARRSSHNTHLRKSYGITIDEYDTILAAQGGVCAICRGGTSKRHFAVDHNHKSGHVRGLLCARCNSALARFMDKRVNVGRAYRYLGADGERVREILGREVKVPDNG